MKKVIAVALLVAGVVSLSAATYHNFTPFDGTCTQTTGCYNGKKKVRTGSQTNCQSGGTGTCTSTDCSYGEWETQSC